MEWYVWAIGVGFVAVCVFGLIHQWRERDKAKAAYQYSLAQLKRDPTNADLRERTLQLGRVYSNLTRNNKGVTIFDEVALMNDINAACGGIVGIRDPAGKGPHSVEERLARLASLKAKGLIDAEEYRAQKQRIIDEL